jgi:hypothetical protein
VSITHINRHPTQEDPTLLKSEKYTTAVSIPMWEHRDSRDTHSSPMVDTGRKNQNRVNKRRSQNTVCNRIQRGGDKHTPQIFESSQFRLNHELRDDAGMKFRTL